MTRTYKRTVWHNGQTTQHKWKKGASRVLRRMKKIDTSEHVEPTKRDVTKYNRWTSPKESIYGAFIKKKVFYQDLEEYGLYTFHKRHTYIFTIGRELPHKKHYRKHVDKNLAWLEIV